MVHEMDPLAVTSPYPEPSWSRRESFPAVRVEFELLYVSPGEVFRDSAACGCYALLAHPDRCGRAAREQECSRCGDVAATILTPVGARPIARDRPIKSMSTGIPALAPLVVVRSTRRRSRLPVRLATA